MAAPDDERAGTAVGIVAAHPDDEVIGATTLLLRHRHTCRVLHVTDGAPRDARDAIAAGLGSRQVYARVRRLELEAALHVIGVDPARCDTLPVVDQEAVFELLLLARHIAGWVAGHGIDTVVTHPYEGGHPDHDAAAFAVHAAVALLERDSVPAPAIVEMTSYHHGENGMETGDFLPGRGPAAAAVALSRRQRLLKEIALRCFVTQQRTLAPFGVDCERFRPAPAYRFAAPPHAGRLFYEHFDWGTDGANFRRLACACAATLRLEDERWR